MAASIDAGPATEDTPNKPAAIPTPAITLGLATLPNSDIEGPNASNKESIVLNPILGNIEEAVDAAPVVLFPIELPIPDNLLPMFSAIIYCPKR
jgi:hypothetical protein